MGSSLMSIPVSMTQTELADYIVIAFGGFLFLLGAWLAAYHPL